MAGLRIVFTVMLERSQAGDVHQRLHAVQKK